MRTIAAVEKLSYRQSRLCRFLGNPVAFGVVAFLASGKDLSTGEIPIYRRVLLDLPFRSRKRFAKTQRQSFFRRFRKPLRLAPPRESLPNLKSQFVISGFPILQRLTET